MVQSPAEKRDFSHLQSIHTNSGAHSGYLKVTSSFSLQVKWPRHEGGPQPSCNVHSFICFRSMDHTLAQGEFSLLSEINQ